MSENSGGGVFGWVLFAVIAAGCWDAIRDTNLVATLYATNEYDVPRGKVTFAGKRPYDCDFMTAPIGSKHCDYQRDYLVEWVSLSGDNPPRPISYGTMQTEPPMTCSQDPNDFAHKCYYIDDEPGAKAILPGWHARAVEVRWLKVPD